MPILRWLSRDEDIKVARQAEYRLLREVPEFGAGEHANENIIVQGDNLDALKSLLPFYAGQVKCIYIDPPFNTGSAFDYYDDNLKHTIWLSIMYPRLELLRSLLKEDGVICVHLDGSELAYMKVVMDEIFGRNNYLNMITLTTNDPSGFKATATTIFSTANYILIYARNRNSRPLKKSWVPKMYDPGYSAFLTNKSEHYSQWRWSRVVDEVAKIMGFATAQEALKKERESFQDAVGQFAIENASQVFQLVAIGGVAAIKRKDTIAKSKANKNQVFVHPNEDVSDFYILNGRQIVFYDKRIMKIDGQMVPAELITDVWTDISWNGIGPEGGVIFKNGKKPEKLIQRILEITTEEGDLVLDSFLGSGTTAAVAHKMKRRYIGIEMGEQAKTHCAIRLKGVVKGEQSGVSRNVGWKGGGGFRFYELGDMIFGEDGQISETISFHNLAAHIWFYETKTPFQKQQIKTAFLGVHNNIAYSLLFNGILHDKRIDGGNVLTGRTLEAIRAKIGEIEYGKLVVYGASTRIGTGRLKELGVEFKQTPYDIKTQ